MTKDEAKLLWAWTRYHQRFTVEYAGRFSRYLFELKRDMLDRAKQVIRTAEADAIAAAVTAGFAEYDRKLLLMVGPLYNEAATGGASISNKEFADRGFRISGGHVLSPDTIQAMADKTIKIKEINQTIRDSLKGNILKAMNENSSPAGVQEAIRRTMGFTDFRSLMIARTEMGQAMALGRQNTADQAGIEEGSWLTAGDEVVRPSHVEAAAVGSLPRGETFAGTECEFPCDPNGPAGEIINCRCCWIPTRQAAVQVTVPATTPIVEAPLVSVIDETLPKVYDFTDLNSIENLRQDYLGGFKGTEAEKLVVTQEYTKSVKNIESVIQRLSSRFKTWEDIYAQPAYIEAKAAQDAALKKLYGFKESATQELLNLIGKSEKPARDFKLVVKFETPLGKAEEAAIRAKMTEHLKEFHSYLGENALSPLGKTNINIVYHNEFGRAYFSEGVSGQSYLHLFKDVDKATIWHELGHYLEKKSSTAFTEAKKLYKSRTGTESAVSLKKLFPQGNYFESELTKKDGWMHPYMGLVCVDPFGIISGMLSTELISMGLQYFIANPIEFAIKEPELFRIIIKILKGL